jgi:hypothetical protein
MRGRARWMRACRGIRHSARSSMAVAIAAMLSLTVFLAPGYVDAESVTVVGEPVRSSSHPRIMVTDHDRPIAQAKVQVFRLSDGLWRPGRLFASITTNRRGMASIAALPPGDYSVQVTAEPCYMANLELEVRSSGKGKSTFSIPLDVFTEYPSGEPCPAIESCPDTGNTQLLRGTVTDPTDAVIAGAHVSLLRDETRGERCGAALTTDREGKFQVKLPVGSYRLGVNSLGFRKSVLPVMLDPEKEPGQLHIVLHVGGS